jgi:hypothetical protein
MALFDLDNLRKNANPAAAEGKQKKPSALVWLNIGYTVKGEDGEDVFIGLPVGLPLDDMKEMEAKGSNPGWHQLVEAKNALLTYIKEAAKDLKPGEYINLDGLEIQAYRRNEAVVPHTNDNPLVNQMFSGLGKTGTNG